MEYLPLTDESAGARARLGRILRDRFNLERMRRETVVDTLTKLPARHAFLDQLESEWTRALNASAPISLVLLDLDGFKAYNRSHGYLTGDRSLVIIADQLKKELAGRAKVLSRFGGNEFAILLPNVDAAETEPIAQRLQGCIAEARIENRTNPTGEFLTASVGWHTVVPLALGSMHELVDGASRDLQARRR